MKLDKEKTKPKAGIRKEIIKIRMENSEIETDQQQRTIMETKNWFSEEVNKIDKLLPWRPRKQDTNHQNQE